MEGALPNVLSVVDCLYLSTSSAIDPWVGQPTTKVRVHHPA